MDRGRKLELGVHPQELIKMYLLPSPRMNSQRTRMLEKLRALVGFRVPNNWDSL